MMKHSKRKRVHKGHSARQFRKSVSKTHPRNVAVRPMRGGWRL